MLAKNMPKYLVAAALMAAATTVTACKGGDNAASDNAPAEAPQSVETALAAINDSLGRMNYGEAARLAADAQATYPGDYRIHAAAARAQARLGDAVAAATAFGRAVETGQPDAAKLLAEPAFDNVRNHSAFNPYRTRPASHRPAARDTTSYVRAGDVEIIESASGDVIRAGDLVLDTRR